MIFTAIQYLDPEENRDPIYCSLRGIPLRGSTKHRKWTPLRFTQCVIALATIAFALVLMAHIWRQL